MIIKLAFRNLWRNKRRTLITAGSVFFAVLLSIFMSSIQKGAWKNMQESVINYHFGYIQIQNAKFWEDQNINNSFITSEINIDAIKTLEGVSSIVPRIESFGLASKENSSKGTLILGIDPIAENEMSQLSDRLISGKYFTSDSSNKVMVSEGLGEYLKAKLGDTLVVLSQGLRGSNAAGKYLISGIVKLGSPELNDQMIYLPIKTAQYFLRAEKRYTSLIVNPADAYKKEVDEIGSKISKELDSEALRVMNWKEMMPDLVQAEAVDQAGGKLVLYILYILIGFGIFGTVIMMLKERQYEFGVLVAIGLERRKLAVILWLEVLFVGFLGTVAGCIGALPLVYYFQENPIKFSGELMEAYEKFGVIPEIPTTLEAGIFLSQIMVIAFIMSLIAIYPILKIMKMKPIEYMRSL